jgi:hypothetical protein
MARHLRRSLEAEADRKGLTGAEKEAYVGGAYQRITHGGERREWWQGHEDRKHLSKLVGEVHELHYSKARPNVVVFRQGRSFYELPLDEYHGLVKEGRRLTREDEKAQKAEARHRRKEDAAIRLYQRELDREQKAEAVRLARAERAEKRAQEASQAALRAVHRAEYREVVAILKASGGVRVEKSSHSGEKHEASEYARLPSTIRNSRGRLTPDYAREAIMEHMPWLKLDTPADFFDYFDREREYKNRQSA